MLRITILIFSVVFLIPFKSNADDSDGNKVAAYIKYSVTNDIRYGYEGDSGFCDVMINMGHKNGYAIIKRVSTKGNSKLCRFIKGQLKKGSRYRYDHPEKLIQLDFEHI